MTTRSSLIEYRHQSPARWLGALVFRNSSGSLAIFAVMRRAGQSKADRRATATDYCFGGNGGATCIGLDESCVETCAECSCVETCAGCSCVETCAGCCAGFGSGVRTGLSAREEDESRAILCREICSWMRVSWS